MSHGLAPSFPLSAYQKAVKEQRLALELASATRERDFYLKQVDQGKAIDAMAAKQQRRAQAAAEAGAAAGGDAGAQEPPRPAKAGGARIVRTFQQARVFHLAAGLLRIELPVTDALRGAQRPVRAAPAAPRLSQSVLAQVFGAPRGEKGGGGGGGGGGDEARPRKKQRPQAAEE
jgi:hypothetical protein